MPRFFIEDCQITNNQVTIVGEDAHHIGFSLRMAVGDSITVCNMKSTEYDCIIRAITQKEVVCDILSSHKSLTEPPYEAVLYQALPKGEKLDFIIQKSVECGASGVVLFESERCIAKDNGSSNKYERRNRIALEAAKQCGRGIIPFVSEVVTFQKMLEMAEKADVKIFCYEGEDTLSLPNILEEKKGCKTISIIIGSEGGFSPKEVEVAKNKGFFIAGLGKRILRTETAGIVTLASLSYAWEL